MHPDSARCRQVLLTVAAVMVALSPVRMAAAQSVSLPSEPVSPTSEKECIALQRANFEVVRELREQIRACSDRQPVGPDVIISGLCPSWTYPVCRGMVQQCAAVQAEANAAVARCRVKVARARTERELTQQAARATARAALGDTLPGARDAYDKFQYVHGQTKNVQEAFDFLLGRQTNAQRIDSLTKGSKSIYGATGAHGLARRNFDDAISRLSTHYKQLLRDFEQAIASTSALRAPMGGGATPAPSRTPDHARIAALRQEIFRNSQLNTERERVAAARATAEAAAQQRARAAEQAQARRRQEAAQARWDREQQEREDSYSGGGDDAAWIGTLGSVLGGMVNQRMQQRAARERQRAMQRTYQAPMVVPPSAPVRGGTGGSTCQGPGNCTTR